ncbi:DMT family transporter [Deinococcus cellulosilyticus]|uniref:Permease n=1 Tax=Deinococcus cellulosilyticus (strain DSM 18568 / NBRC 106333 / KACC 11606 / 5516J-15) TaxID=1223518 RepID=A0A511N5X7_DEIC1|nr:EamA family transporter [Deinococcus cellulosilyticus]GEM47867.1 permease [Deinococcus cellulosilyticus NBRC 106333 = KACC 11606]
MRPHLKGTLMVVISAFGFATLGIFAKFSYQMDFNFQSTLAWRFGLAALVLFLLMLLKKEWTLKPEQRVPALLLGMVGYAIQASVYFLALQHLSAGLTALLLYAYPAFVTLLEWWLERKTPTKTTLFALLLAFAGIVLTTQMDGKISVLGIVLAVASGVWYAIYLTVSSRIIRDTHPVPTSAFLSLGAALAFLTWALLGEGFNVPHNAAEGMLLFGIATVATVIPVIGIFYGIRILGTSQTAILSTLEPIFTLLLGALLLHETLAPQQFVGGAMVLGSVVLLQLRQSYLRAKAA